MKDICKHGLLLKHNCYICGIEMENARLRDVLMDVYQKARNDVARWDGGQCVGLQTFSDRMFARKLVRDIEPILFPEVSE